MARAAAQTVLSNGEQGSYRGAGRRVGSMTPEETHYLWALYLLILGATYALRHVFRRSHGG